MPSAKKQSLLSAILLLQLLGEAEVSCNKQHATSQADTRIPKVPFAPVDAESVTMSVPGRARRLTNRVCFNGCSIQVLRETTRVKPMGEGLTTLSIS